MPATTFLSENPGKKAGHVFKKDSIRFLDRGDVDVVLEGDTLVRRMEELGYKPHEKYPHIYFTADVHKVFPELKAFSNEWGKKLKRPVNIALLVDPKNATTGARDFVTKKKAPSPTRKKAPSPTRKKAPSPTRKKAKPNRNILFWGAGTFAVITVPIAASVPIILESTP
ncbi:MAG: hypothetical protein H6618_06800 [Deltaproteobacteria bacterium]|nr:hypothetical protein [Deltaproteobacteria bacterium]